MGISCTKRWEFLIMIIQQLLGANFETIAVRICIAAVLCGVIGFEREVKRHAAGFRTHLLVGVGACLMMLLSLYGFSSYIDSHSNIRFDPARIPSYVISGIGFLGAGTIIVQGVTIRGLTTAASIWVVAGLGLIVGVGMYAAAILTTILVLLSLIFLNRFEKHFVRSNIEKKINIVVNTNNGCLEEIISKFEQEKISIQTFEIKEYEKVLNQDFTLYTFIVTYKSRHDQFYLFFDKLYKIKSVHKVFE